MKNSISSKVKLKSTRIKLKLGNKEIFKNSSEHPYQSSEDLDKSWNKNNGTGLVSQYIQKDHNKKSLYNKYLLSMNLNSQTPNPIENPKVNKVNLMKFVIKRRDEKSKR
jgi:hypothetical protein